LFNKKQPQSNSNILEPLKFQKESPQINVEHRNPNQTHCRNSIKFKSKSDINAINLDKENSVTHLTSEKSKERSMSSSREENFANEIELPNLAYEVYEDRAAVIDVEKKANDAMKENELLLGDINSSKKDQSTKVSNVTTLDQCVQTDLCVYSEKQDIILFGLTSLNLYEKVCSLVECELLNELLDVSAKAELSYRESLQQGKLIPNSPPRLEDESVTYSTTAAALDLTAAISKPSQANSLNATVLLPSSSNKLSLPNRSANLPVKIGAESSGLSNFSELLEIGYNEMRRKSTIGGKSAKRDKRVLALEFQQQVSTTSRSENNPSLHKTNINNISILDNESEYKEKVNKQSVEADNVTESLELATNNNKIDVFVVAETPVKNNDSNFVWVQEGDQAELAELNRTLSRSATRMVYAEQQQNPNRNSLNLGADTTIPSKYDETIPLSAVIETSLMPKLSNQSSRLVKNSDQNILDATSLSSNKLRQQNGNQHSFMLNSFNIDPTNENASEVPTLVLTTNNDEMSQNARNRNVQANAKKVIPAAVDLLGESVNNNEVTLILSNNSEQKASTIREDINHSSTKENERSEQTLSKVIIKTTVENATSSTNRSKKEEEETQLLTDSELFKIDALCKNMYSSHNQTINNEFGELNTSVRSRSYPRASLVSGLAEKKKMEFVYSLLNSETKVNYINFCILSFFLVYY
jgi:hypothetical protein